MTKKSQAFDITKRLRALRAEGQMTQPDLARLVNAARPDWNWHQTTVAKIEAGDRAVKLDELLAFAEVFGMGLDEFVFGADETRPGHQTQTSRERRTLELARKRWELEMYRRRVRDLEQSIEEHIATAEKWDWDA